MTPDYVRSRFVYRDMVSAYRLRNKTNKHFHNLELIILRESFSYSGAQLWNTLTIGPRQARSLTDFKSK